MSYKALKAKFKGVIHVPSVAIVIDYSIRITIITSPIAEHLFDAIRSGSVDPQVVVGNVLAAVSSHLNQVH